MSNETVYVLLYKYKSDFTILDVYNKNNITSLLERVNKIDPSIRERYYIVEKKLI